MTDPMKAPSEAWAALDWDIRVRVPKFLRGAGLVEDADALANLPPITSIECLAPLKDITSKAAKAAYALWLKRKPALGSVACAACRCAAVEASKMTLLPPGQAALPVAAEVARVEAGLRAEVLVGTGDAEGAADWSAAVIACGDFECSDLEVWERARARLHPIVIEVMRSWQHDHTSQDTFGAEPLGSHASGA